ncbi:hypothetical protein [Bacillus cereus group sp. TH152-1LC]|uniref:hypothetical protein n=1 Tax=Bacillus cereus group sp. TH152-1LC TaxID=3018060 RepID=UPI0022E67C9D|nr:hypothetical protein [Bacillus cereus group sp. TH152-1LC]MDA1675727.1 hypothetical protein [Bacillus cereus group sp. TH152-1LC]
MKKHTGIIVSAFACISFILGGCGTTKTNETPKTETVQTTKDVREIAWSSLVDSEKEEVTGTWKEAKVSKVKADGGFLLKDKSFEGKEVTMVTFNSKNALLGDIIKLVDEKSGKVIGAGGRG